MTGIGQIGGLHQGAIDIVYANNANIVASVDGTIEEKFTCPNNHKGVDEGCPNKCHGYGNGVIIRGTDGRAYKYAHMVAGSIPENIYRGATVKKGQVIGRVGETGNAYGVHLHFGITTGDWWNTNGNPLTENYIYSLEEEDKTVPVVTEAYIDPTSFTGTSYTIRAKATDNVEIDRMEFPTWTKGGSNEQDDIVWHVGKYNSSTGYYEYTVKASEHNGEIAMYATHAYAFDKAGNKSKGYVLEPVYIGEKFTNNLGDFDATIALKSNTKYVIGTKFQSNELEDLQLSLRSSSDKSQLWRFIKQADGSYAITSYKGLIWDVAGGANKNNTNIQTYKLNETDAQYYYIMSYNGGYRFVPRHSNDMKSVGIDEVKNGNSIKLYQTKSNSNSYLTWKLETQKIESSEPKVCYTAHVQDVGWQYEVHDGTTAGTMHKSRRVEAIKIRLDSNIPGGIEYRSHIQENGWETKYRKDGEMSGTTHESKRIEAIAIKLTGEIAGIYDVYYRAYVQDKGWMEWVKNGSDAGTSHQQLRLEAIQIKLVKKYPDVENNKWYRSSVSYVSRLGLMNGYSSGTYKGYFGVNDKLTRAHIVTILYRLSLSPNVQGKTNFPDVQDSSKYYYKAVVWANKNGIVNGYSSGEKKGNFGPNDNITRQDLAGILRNYAKYRGKYINISNDLKGFKDSSKVSKYALSSMKWAVGTKVISGNGDGTLNPKGNATRAEASAMITNFCKNVLNI